MTTPAITTGRLTLLPAAGEIPTLVLARQVSWLRDPVVVRWSRQRYRQHNVLTQKAYVESFDHDGAHLWRILFMNEDIGTISAHRDIVNRTADLGLMVGDRSMWGMGLGSEAWGVVMAWLFRNGCDKVEAGHVSGNIGMRGVCKKNEMVLEGIVIGSFLIEGARQHKYLWGKFATPGMHLVRAAS